MTRSWRSTLAVTCGALLLFAPTIVQFRVETTELSAIRVLGGEVLYRDMWTMYGPGGIYAMAAAYGLFGVQMIVGRILGILVSAASVGALYRLALRVSTPLPAAAVSAVFAFAFLAAGYQNSVSSYQPAILLILLAMDRVAAHAESGSRRDLVSAGLLLGFGALFKHDVVAYACVSVAVALLAVPRGTWPERMRAVALVAVLVVGVMAVPLALLLAAGAGPAMADQLLRFPTTYFPVVRPEGFRVLPRLTTNWQSHWTWLSMNGPSWALLAGLPGAALGWRVASPAARRAVAMSVPAFVFYWLAAHVQANTHVISMAAFGPLIAAAGMLRYGTSVGPKSRPLRWAMRVAPAAWCAAMLAPWAARVYYAGLDPALVGLPRLAGIVTSSARAEQLRELARAIEGAGPPEAPLLQVGWRNDVLIYADAIPYWLTERPMVTPYHELHPGVTDVETGQRRILAELADGPRPVIVLEHRFDAATLDYWGERYREGGVPVGVTLLDDWVAANYEPGVRIGMHEVMRARPFAP